MTFSFGTKLKMYLFGESHGKCVGVVVEGIPPGTPVDLKKIQEQLDRRRPGQNLMMTQRNEEDKVEVLSGMLEGKATGAPITMLVKNKDAISAHYEELKDKPRPGHADFPARVKFGAHFGHRGGGIFSGRMTAGLVMAGALARELLEGNGISVQAHLKEVHGMPTEAGKITPEIEAFILEMRRQGDTVGGIVECRAEGLPVGLGEPFFDSLESVLSHAMFSIPAVKGIEFGAGFACAGMLGSEHNDAFVLREGRVATETNHAGGILGGLSNGMPLEFRVAVKPASSIAKEQKTVNLKSMQEETLQVKGRHDPCIAIRAVPVVENFAAFVVADFLLQARKNRETG